MHRIESHHLDSLPGRKLEYSAWEELWANLEAMVKPYRKLVMQYSPNNQIPYISLVDAGMLDLIRSFGKEIETSANLVARFEATLTEAQIASHYKAQAKVDPITAGAFQEIGAASATAAPTSTKFSSGSWKPSAATTSSPATRPTSA